MDITPTDSEANASSSGGFFAVVLLRKGEEAKQAEVLLPSDEYASYPFNPTEDRAIKMVAHLGKAARAAAEQELRTKRELHPDDSLSRVVEVYADNPTTTHNLQYGKKYDLKSSSQRTVLAGEDKLGVGQVEKYYVLVTVPAVPMQFSGLAFARSVQGNQSRSFFVLLLVALFRPFQQLSAVAVLQFFFVIV